jgi:hypothetical protein
MKAAQSNREEFFVDMVGDNRRNRRLARDQLRMKGVKKFVYQTVYSISDDQMILRVRGFNDRR